MHDYTNRHGGHLPCFPISRAVEAIRSNDLCLNTDDEGDLYDAVWDDVYSWLIFETFEVHNREEGFDPMQRADGITEELLDKLLNCAVV